MSIPNRLLAAVIVFLLCLVVARADGISSGQVIGVEGINNGGVASAPSAPTVPGPPTIGTATGGNAQASITFTPGSNGGSAITGFTATSSPGSFMGTCASSPCVVTGLTNGTAYTFTVTATNTVGTGAASSTSNSVTPATVPGAPTIGTATAGNASATVAFTAPGSNGGSAITGYTATSTPSSITGTGASSPITVSSLANGTAYTFTVTATNAVGTGAASAASNSVTPSAGSCSPVACPGDAVSGSITFLSLRCYQYAYSGNVADVWDGATGSTTETLITCSNGNLVTSSPTSLATTCAVSCKIKTWYDQSGNNACGSAPCNLTQATNANRPTLTLNCTNSTIPCALFVRSSGTYLLATGTITQAYPFSLSFVFNAAQQGGAGGGGWIWDDQVHMGSFVNSIGANELVLYQGNSNNSTASNSVTHAIQVVFQSGGTTSTIDIDGTTTTPGAAGTNGAMSGNTMIAGAVSSSAQFLDGKVMEINLYGSALSSGNQATLCHSQFTYFGTGVSC